MPEDSADKQSELALGGGDSTTPVPTLPPVVPPNTKTPFQFNQQINIQQLSPKALEKLSAEQLYDLSKSALAQFERTDERHFKWALEQTNSSAKTQRIAMFIGGFIALGGFGAVTYLTIQGHQVIAAIVGTFLGTIIAVTIGNRMFQ